MGRTNTGRYGPGGFVRITVNFLRQMKIKDVTATFANQQAPDSELVMSAEPKFYNRQEVLKTHKVSRSHADFIKQIPAKAVPGVYSLKRLELTTYSDRPYLYEGENLGSQ